MFFLVSGLLDRLVYLSTGLALVLAFIGVKLMLHWGHAVNGAVPEISTGLSLAVIGVVLAVTVVASLVKVSAGSNRPRSRWLAAWAPAGRPATA